VNLLLFLAVGGLFPTLYVCVLAVKIGRRLCSFVLFNVSKAPSSTN